MSYGMLEHRKNAGEPAPFLTRCKGGGSTRHSPEGGIEETISIQMKWGGLFRFHKSWLWPIQRLSAPSITWALLTLSLKRFSCGSPSYGVTQASAARRLSTVHANDIAQPHAHSIAAPVKEALRSSDAPSDPRDTYLPCLRLLPCSRATNDDFKEACSEVSSRCYRSYSLSPTLPANASHFLAQPVPGVLTLFLPQGTKSLRLFLGVRGPSFSLDKVNKSVDTARSGAFVEYIAR